MKIRGFFVLTAIVTFLVVSPSSVFAGTRYVSASGSNTPPYDTWEKASHTIQAAIDVSSSTDTILVAPGTYSPVSGEQFPIHMGSSASGIVVGGAGEATQTIVDAQGSGAVLRVDSCVTTTTLACLTLTGGSGAGLDFRRSKVSVVGCRIMKNQGGGIYGELGLSLNLHASVVDSNGSSGIYLYYLDPCTLDMDSCSVSHNGNNGVSGPGPANIEDCEVSGNGHNGIFVDPSPLSVTRSRICNNAQNGVSYGEGSLSLQKCLVAGNSGYGIYVSEAVGSIVECTICDNTNSGIYCFVYSPGIGFSIMSDNGGYGVSYYGPAPTLSCCDIFGNTSGDWVGGIANQYGVNGNFSAEPFFCDRLAHNYYLANISPCAPDNSPPQCGLIGALPVDCLCGVEGPIASASTSMLDQNVPNPFNPVTQITFSVTKPGKVVLRIYDIAGRHLRALADGWREPGVYSEVWDGRDDAGKQLSSGVYFYRLDAGDFVATRTMVLLR